VLRFFARFKRRRAPLRDGMPFYVMLAVFLSCYLTWRPLTAVMFTASDALFMLGLMWLTYRRSIPLQPFAFLTNFWLVGVALLIGGLLLGSINCPDPTRWLIVSVQYLFAWAVLPMILLGRGQDRSSALLESFVWGVFAMNLFGAVVYFTYTGTFDDARARFGLDFLSGGHRLGAFASDANWNGAVLAMAIPSVFYLRAKQLVGNVLTIIWLAVLALGVTLSASFTAFISCVAAVIIFVAVGGIRPSARTALLTTLAGSAALLTVLELGVKLPSVFMSRVGNAVDSGDISEAGTFEGRMQLIRESWGMVQDHLLIGVGADQYRVVSAFKAPVHDMYLLLWAEGGLIALIGWLTMIAVMVAAAALAYSRDRIASALSLSVVTTFGIASTASPHMYARLWSVPVLLALAVSIEAWREGAPAVLRGIASRAKVTVLPATR
jgi:hypothetical protein